MNQILTTEKNNKSSKSPAEITSIVKFFAVSIILFGVVLVGEGIYTIYKKIDETNPKNNPIVTISRSNDKAIVYVEHNIEINKILYSWDNGEVTEVPEGGIVAQEEILLPNEDSVLNLVIEDSKGKQVLYQKEFLLTGVDITKPAIEIITTNGSNMMTIIAKDETEISYISYQWEDEEVPTYFDATEQGQTKIEQEIELQTGTKTIKIVAEDTNGNIGQLEKEIIATTSKPKVILYTDGPELRVEIQDDDGIKDVEININGEVKSATNINQKHIKVGPVTLIEGNNIINVKVTNISGYTGSITKELQYTP